MPPRGPIETLWDLLRGRPAQQPPTVIEAKAPKPPSRSTPSSKKPPANGAMTQKYERMQRELLAEYGIKVRRWRSAMSGVAWEMRDKNGKAYRYIEAPKPKGPMSAAVFCHEVGHHAIGFNRYRPRCLEEYHAWAWSLSAMERFGLNVTPRVRERMHDSLHYAVCKARRRGLKRLPAELEPYAAPRVRVVRA